MNFVAIDVETANSDVGSICQIGMAKYARGKLVDTYCSLINPQATFDSMNINVHGIDSEMVENAPSISDVHGDILQFIGDNILLNYTNFDKRAMTKCLADHHIPMPSFQWVDASMMVRDMCQKFAHKGYGLANVCKEWGYKFNHHDALEDAKACGFIATTILRENSLSVTDWTDNGKYHRRNATRFPTNRAIAGNATGRFYGLNICFTGELSIMRSEISDIAANHGFHVKAGVSKKLDYLVVGTPDLRLLNGHDKSSKQRKSEEIVANGGTIQIIEEHEFLKLIGLNN